MEQTQTLKDLEETTAYLIPMIQKVYDQNPTGSLKGYLVMDEDLVVVSKKQLKAISSVDENGKALSYHGSVKCSETDPDLHSLKSIMINRKAQDILTTHFQNQNFKKFDICFDCFPEYRYSENKRIKYRRTGHELIYMKVDIQW